eukprot:TRINITY_DN7778_c0_g1_i1.p1 TRINITY_DN7778_c0_g1~~TRINITY_DN7778_c0_g1_i1.p1  ORF type:complete len:246 (-),score=53.99 TRINITY_DN7778_c0_g1_i1:184-921(-)
MTSLQSISATTVTSTTSSSSSQDASYLSSLKASQVKNQSVQFANYAQMSTVTTAGLPSCRSVCMRGYFTDDKKQTFLVTTSDSRAGKIQDFGKVAFTELCWYFPLSFEQYRLFCSVQVIDETEKDELRKKFRAELWSKLSPSMRQTFTSLHPGKVLVQQKLSDVDKFSAQSPSAFEPLSTFVVLLLCPLKVDHLILPSSTPSEDDKSKPLHKNTKLIPRKPKESRRFVHTLNKQSGVWKIDEVVP